MLELVTALPWQTYATRTAARFVLTRQGLHDVAAAIRTALDAGQITLEEADRVARAALEQAKKDPFAYLVGAFSAARLGDWLGRTDVVAEYAPGVPSRTSASSVALASSSAVVERPACSTCGAQAGDPPHLRTTDDGAGGLGPCPDCHPGCAQ